ncbi:MAG: GPR endopeptidase [Candidatus Fimivivens sp.]
MKKTTEFRTDLALEAADTGDGKLPSGVSVSEKVIQEIKVTTVGIETPQAVERLGRPIGTYLTFEGAFTNDQAFINLLTDSLLELLPEGPVLVVGLGNRDITPDALGPDVAQQVIVTYHFLSEQLESIGLQNLRKVCSLAPGVMGQTGFEAANLVSAALKTLPFSAVIAVDALAARSASRLGKTIQLSTSGISPGSGVLNARAELSSQSLGVPVFSFGIPTVVDAATLLNDFCPSCNSTESALSMMVTPRDIDQIITQGARIMAVAINCALQPQLSQQDITALMS